MGDSIDPAPLGRELLDLRAVRRTGSYLATNGTDVLQLDNFAGKISGAFEEEVKQALDNIGAVLKAAAMSPEDVVSVQVYLTDAATFERINAVYKGHFKEPRPTRTTVVVAKLVGQCHVEITVTTKK